VPHPATKMLGWSVNSGRLWKLSCGKHANEFGGPAYVIADLVGCEDNQKRLVHPLVAPRTLSTRRGRLTIPGS
jgi:hypothetical protein